MEPLADGGERPGAVEAATGLAGAAAGAWLRTARWSARTTLRTGRRLAAAAAGGDSATSIARDATSGLIEGAQRVLGVTELDERLARVLPGPAANASGEGPLRERGRLLLERSSELDGGGGAHPAYARILDQLSPDEARILRLLATDGPQPAIDVRTWRPLDLGSNVVAPGLSMIAQNAGCMRPDRVPAYLSNLYRLGLIWFSRERMPDPAPYQVLEAQPETVEALGRAGRARIVRRSIHLTPFGGQFCSYCLPLEGEIVDDPTIPNP